MRFLLLFLSFLFVFNYMLHIYLLCVRVCVCLWRSEDKLWESVLIRWVLGLEFMLSTLALIPHQKSILLVFFLLLGVVCLFVFKTGAQASFLLTMKPKMTLNFCSPASTFRRIEDYKWTLPSTACVVVRHKARPSRIPTELRVLM